MLSEDGHTIRWSRPIDSFLFTMEHLCSNMGSKYLESNVQVHSFDEVMQALCKDKIKPDMNGNYWGKPQGDPPQEEVHRHTQNYGNTLQGTIFS
jgi:hypothetical protein